MHLSSRGPAPLPPDHKLLKSNKRGSPILFFSFPHFHKSQWRGMLRMGSSSSPTAAPSPHYQPCCSYYALTSSALIKINVLRYHSVFFLLFPLLSRPRKRIFFCVCEPALNQFATWSRCGSLYFTFIPTFSVSPKTGKKNTNEKAFSLTFLVAPYPVVSLATQQSA